MKVLKTGGSFNAGQKLLQNVPVEYSVILLTCIKQLQVLRTYFLSSFEWLLKTGLTVNQTNKAYIGSFCSGFKSEFW